MKKIVVLLSLYLLHTQAMDLKNIVVTMNGERVELSNYQRVRTFDQEFYVANIKALCQSPILASQIDDCADQSDVTCCIEYENSSVDFKKFFYPMQVLTRLNGSSDEDVETTKINQYLTKHFSFQKLRDLIEHVSLADYLEVEPLTERLVSNITERASELATDYQHDASLLDPLTGDIKNRIARAIAAQKTHRVLLKELRPLPLPIAAQDLKKNQGITSIKWCKENNSFFVVDNCNGTDWTQQYKIKCNNNRTDVEVFWLKKDQLEYGSGIYLNGINRKNLSEKPYLRIANIVDSEPDDITSHIYFAGNSDYIVINHTKKGKIDFFENTMQIYDYATLKSVDRHIRQFASLEQLLLIELLSRCLVANNTKSNDWQKAGQFCFLFSGKKKEYISFIESPHLKDSYSSMDIMLKSFLNSCHNSLPIQSIDPFNDLQSIR